MAKRIRPRTQWRQKRKAAALVELAVCLPAIVALTFGTIEATTMMFLKQSLAITAYEGVRVAIKKGTSTTDVENACNQILTSRRIQNSNITIEPASLTGVSPGEEVMVRISAPVQDNSVMQLRFFTGSISAEVCMVRE
ncbi:MAG: pilus assembly protein [Planctomycetales bacterium]|nr:pilus assembly protein [Planctomycetales bacterium]